MQNKQIEPLEPEVQTYPTEYDKPLTKQQLRLVKLYFELEMDAEAAVVAAGYQGNWETVWKRLQTNPIFTMAILQEAKRIRDSSACDLQYCIGRLMEEAEDKGENSSHAARVAALDKLTRIHGGYEKKQQDKSIVAVNMDFGDLDDEDEEERDW